MKAIEKLIQNAKLGLFGDNWLGVAEEAEKELARLKQIEEAAKESLSVLYALEDDEPYYFEQRNGREVCHKLAILLYEKDK